MQYLMEVQKVCDFCKEQRSMIYCRSDAAYLCLSCDRSVHSANSLSSRHLRTLVCERCNCQIAMVRCLVEKLSLCQNCNSSGHGTHASATEHKRQTINSYSGCPSAAELSNIWSFFYPDESNCNPEADSVILEDGNKSLSQSPLTQEAAMDPTDSDVEQFDGIESFNSVDQKVYRLLDACEDFNISEIDWNVENCEALFGESHDDPQQFFEDGGFDSFFGIEIFCGTECSEECTHEVKGTELKTKTTQQECSNPVSTGNDKSSKSDPDILSPRPAQSSFSPSFPDPTVDHETGAHKSSGVLGEHACIAHHPEYRLSSAIRDCAVLRYKEKRKSRKFDRKIRYASRKAGAEVRKRVRGRFVKAGDPYDYDPMHSTKEFTLPKVFLETHGVSTP